MNERLKQLRLALELNQSDLSKRIGVSRSAISRLESGDINFTEQMILSICREFNVNRAWLVEGVGDMFTNMPETLIDELAIEYKLSDEAKELVYDFCNLTEDERALVLSFLRGRKRQ